MSKPIVDAPKTTPEDAILWTDGAARGNPGPAGIGMVLKTLAGDVVFADGEFIGNTTNNVAEYKALLLGLERALQRGVRRIEVRADSELLIKQLRGQYRMRSEHLRPLYENAMELLRKFEASRLVHVPRKQNAEADHFANQGIDKAKEAGKA
jgi:ribonuclease HI